MQQAVLGFYLDDTGTRCAVMSSDGIVLGKGEAGSDAREHPGEDSARQGILRSVEQALAAIDGEVGILGAFVGMPGVTTQAERTQLRTACAALGIAPLWWVTDSVVPHLAAGTKGREGILVAAGADSFCWGCDAAGASARAGGWGHVLGSEGSAFFLARRALSAALRAYDGRGPKTSLVNRFLHRLALDDLGAVVGMIHQQEAIHPWIVALAPLVVEAALQGDRIANELLDEAAGEHVAAVLAVYRRLHFPGALTVVASGSLFEQTDVLLQRVRRLLAQLLPDAEVVLRDVEPAIGACYLALRAVKGDPWPPDLEGEAAGDTGLDSHDDGR